MKKTAYVIALSCLALSLQAVTLDNFESYTPGDVTAPWITVTGSPTFGQETGGNQYLLSYGSYMRLDNHSLGDFSIPNSDTETTLFFRIYDLGGTNPDVSAGLCNTTAPGLTWNDYECYVVLVSGELRARNGSSGNIAIVSPNLEATWYNIWLVINNSANTYDVYVTTGSANATSGDLKADNFTFRNGGTSSLLSFKVYGNSYAPIRVDDISVTDGIDLTIPADGPTPAVIITNPVDAAANETQNVQFHTVFTSETSPSAAWYKVALPSDIAMDSADVETSYDSQAGQYTSTLTLTNLTMSDAGQYYCRVNNESGHPRDSGAADLAVYGLVAHWTFDQDDYTAGQYMDIAGGHDADAAGTPTFVAGADGQLNTAVQISSTDGWAALEGFNPSTTGQLTVSLWTNWQQIPLGTSTDLAITPSGEAPITKTDGLVSSGQWQHLCMVFDGSNGRLYIDGVMQAEGTLTLPPDLTSLMNIGSSDDGSESFNGCLDDMRIYNYALTDIQVEDIYNAMAGSGDTTPPAAPTGLTAEAAGGTISLNWDENSEPDLAGYIVKRSITQGSGYSAIATNVLVSDYIDASAAGGTRYYYVVCAVDTNGNQSSNSSEQSAPLYAGDLTLDNRVDLLDVAELSSDWQAAYDMNNLLDIADDWLN